MRSLCILSVLLAVVGGGCSGKAIPGCRCDGQIVATTYVHYATLRDVIVVVVWSDLGTPPAGGWANSGHAVNISSERAEYHGDREASDGRAVKWKAVTTDGRTGTVTLNGKHYRLEDGAVFLVRTGDGAAQVAQVTQDLSGMKPAAETWNLLAKQNTEIKKFLDEASRGK
jgi:hypothetical protein